MNVRSAAWEKICLKRNNSLSAFQNQEFSTFSGGKPFEKVENRTFCDAERPVFHIVFNTVLNTRLKIGRKTVESDCKP